VGDTSMENPAMWWTTKLHIMVPKADAFFHDVLTRTLDTYATIGKLRWSTAARSTVI
jgi:hypothetical protein